MAKAKIESPAEEQAVAAVPAEQAKAQEFIEVKPGLRFPVNRPKIEDLPVQLLGGHPSNTPGVKWTEGQTLDWKKLESPDFPPGVQYTTHRGFKDAAGRLRQTFLVRTTDELQLWAVDL